MMQHIQMLVVCVSGGSVTVTARNRFVCNGWYVNNSMYLYMCDDIFNLIKLTPWTVSIVYRY
jgi:hypothetical protein